MPNGAPALMGAGANRPSRYEAPFMWDGSQGQKDRLIGWMGEAVAEGETFLRGQRAYEFVDVSHRIMNDVGFDELPPTLSHASLNFVKRDVRELVATLSNPRPITAFRCDNPDYSQQSWLLNAMYQAWYWESLADRNLRTALQYAAVEGTGYLMTGWDPGFWGTQRGGISLEGLGVDNVLPIGIPPESWDLQKAYAVIIRRRVPIIEVLRRFPEYQDRLAPDGDVTSWGRRAWNALKARVVPTVHNTYGQDRGYRDVDPSGRALITVYDIYINDAAVNSSGKVVQMGVPGSPWEYQVPSLGSDIATGVFDNGGRPLSRKADYHDARFFPYRRHLVCTRTQVLYDGPSRWWHGEVPLVKFTLDDWPFEYCGVPITKEPAKAQAMMTSLLRAYDDSANARLRPGLGYDGNRVNPETARSFDPRMGGQMVEMNDMIGEAFKLLVDPAYYNMQSDILPLIQWIKEEGTKLTGLHDLLSMQKAAQIPSGDTIEKMTELAGPIATDMARNMEASLRKLGEQWKCLTFEFENVRRRFQLLGANGVTAQDYDFDPTHLVPDALNMPGVPANATRTERARAHMENFRFSILPNSIYQQTQSQRRMALLALADRGMPISPYTILEAFDVPNPGNPPPDEQGKYPTTEIDKWRVWQEQQLQMQMEMQAKVQAMQVAMNPLAALGQAIQGAMGDGGGGAAQGASPKAGSSPKGRPGRPPTAQRSPTLQIKHDHLGVPRSTVAES